MAAITISSDFAAQEKISATVSKFFPSVYFEVMGLDAIF